MASRNLTLDGLRGCLAALVLVDHATLERGSDLLVLPARLAVWSFFIMSACVLTRGWDGHFGRFLVRRGLRLWPVYACCMALGYALSGLAVDPWQFAWIPLHGWPPPANSAAWSLTVEAAAMLVMPLIVFVGRGSFATLAIALLGTFLVQFLTPYAFFAAFFFIGAWISRFPLRWAPLETALPRWLGRVSYPLYICHVPLIHFTGLPLWASIPLALAVAELLARTVEKWSIEASRWAGRLTLKSETLNTGALQAG